MMFILLIFLTLKTGLIEVRHSETTSLTMCEDTRPLVEGLYLKGKFDDGPRPETILSIKSRCEKI